MKSPQFPCAAIIASMFATGAAHAVSLNPRGLGQVLLYPYYTVNNSQDTLLSVVNTSDVGKMAKVRFLEGYNGRTVLDFDIFLSAHDTWTAVVSQADGSSGAKLATSDHSCTLPQLPADGQPFFADTYAGTSTAPWNVADSGPQTIARTREGHIEIVADGDVIPGSDTDVRMTQAQDGTGGGRPPGCSELQRFSETGVQSDIVTPTSGLAGSASIVNVGEGTFFAYNADALTDFTDTIVLVTNIIEFDTLTAANSSEIEIGARAKLRTDSGDALSLDYARGVDAVSAVLMADSINNDYLVSSGLGANTDWIVTFPTKRFYVDALAYPDAPRAPFAEAFTAGHSSVALGLDIYDQEELHQSNRPPADGCGFICPSVAPFILGYEVNAVSFVPYTGSFAPSGVFGSQLAAAFGPLFGNTPYGDAGWARIGFNDPIEPHALSGGTTGGTPVALNGLPAIGFMVYNIINAHAAPGRLANYGGTFAHRSTVSCTHVGAVQGDPCGSD